MSETIHIKPRYYRLFTDPGVEMAEANYRHRHLDWRMPLSEAALICLDVWNTPKTFARDTNERTERVIQTRIVPLLKSVRKAGLQVIHAPATPVAERHPNWVRLAVDKPGKSKKPRKWPPEEFRKKTGVYAQYALPNEPQAAEQTRERNEWRDFHPDVRPVGDEAVILNGQDLNLLCEKRGILHLFYIGFWINMCMIERNYGMLEMLRRGGYNIILLKDCTTGMETHETREGLLCERGIVATLEQIGIYTMTSNDLIDALKEKK